MPPRLDDTKRAAILADIEKGEKSAGRIARDHSVSVSTVTRLAAKAQAGDGWQRSKTKKATAAKQADDKARLAEIRTRLLSLTEAALDQALAELAELRGDKAATVLGIALDKYLALDRHDAAGRDDAGDTRSMLRDLRDGIRGLFPDDD